MKSTIIDSNAIIDLIRNHDKALQRLSEFHNYEFVISHFTYIEVLSGAQKTRKADTAKFLKDYPVIPFIEKHKMKVNCWPAATM